MSKFNNKNALKSLIDIENSTDKEENYIQSKLLIMYSGIDEVETKMKSGDPLYFCTMKIYGFCVNTEEKLIFTENYVMMQMVHIYAINGIHYLVLNRVFML